MSHPLARNQQFAITADEDSSHVRLNMAAMSRTDDRLKTPASACTELSPDGDRITMSDFTPSLLSVTPSQTQRFKVVQRINKVIPYRVWLVTGWVTIFEQAYHLGKASSASYPQQGWRLHTHTPV